MGRKISVLVLVVLLSATLSGCVALLAGAAGGAGTATWLSGKLVQQVDAPFEKTISASREALRSMNLGISKETRNQSVAQIMSNYTDGKTIWIDIHNVSSSSSRIEVRVGAISDRQAAQKILNKILKYL